MSGWGRMSLVSKPIEPSTEQSEFEPNDEWVGHSQSVRRPDPALLADQRSVSFDVFDTRKESTMDALRTPPSRGRALIRPILAFGAIAIGVPLVLAGCGSDNTAAPSLTSPAKASATATDGTFNLNEFTIKLTSQTLSSGTVLLTANNVGSEEHELVLVKASAVSDLPTKADGSVDEDKIAETDKVGEIAHVMSHRTKSSTFRLEPGTYVAFCNLVDQMGSGPMMTENMNGGHVHFARGMYQLIAVK